MLTSSSPPLPAELIVKALREFQLEPSPVQVSAIQQYIAVLLAWNEKINLTAIREPIEILYRHVCESMYAAMAIPLTAGRLADVGSGAGFPGLPLKIARPDLNVFLVESNIKKATFLAEVVRELNFTETRVLVSRYEELNEEVAPLDYVCSRALGEFERFLNWAHSPQVAAKQAILWAGGRDLIEIRSVKGWRWREPIAIPKSLQRFVLVGTREE
jgi:16S rRNA (guanine527-N7)-methyltransferase